MSSVGLETATPRSRPTLAELTASPYLSYAYSYPHKTAYRVLDEPKSLQPLWDAEDRRALFLYAHVPFCEMRCGFCNLFAEPQPNPEIARRYVDTLERQAHRVRQTLGDARFARVAFGGGTPTVLELPLLERLLDVADQTLGASLSGLPVSLETSPKTATLEKLTLARDKGIDRISIGVQSFVDIELSALCRPQTAVSAIEAIERIRKVGFATLNVDLIYGAPEQTTASWLHSIETALRHRPEELYLYPLYVRPLTRMGRKNRIWKDDRLELFREGRALLLSEGYEQISMRMFRHEDAPCADGPVYCCQEDGMVGLGCGARSYTRALHYSGEWAVGARGVREIISSWIDRPDDWFDTAWYGFVLDENEQKTRYLIQSLLNREGVDLSAYQKRFAGSAMQDLQKLRELVGRDLAKVEGDRLVLTASGLERSDAIGPWLYTDEVVRGMDGFDLR